MPPAYISHPEKITLGARRGTGCIHTCEYLSFSFVPKHTDCEMRGRRTRLLNALESSVPRDVQYVPSISKHSPCLAIESANRLTRALPAFVFRAVSCELYEEDSSRCVPRSQSVINKPHGQQQIPPNRYVDAKADFAIQIFNNALALELTGLRSGGFS